MKKQTTSQNNAIYDFLAEGTCSALKERYGALVQTAQTTEFGELDKDVVVLDTETTGFSLNHDELIQIAAARMKKGKISEWFVTFVNPNQPIPEEITHLTGIADKDVADAPSPADAIVSLVDFVGDSDIVAHNADFDRGFVTKDLFGAPLLQNTWIDSLDLARIALPRLKSHRLIDLVHAFGAPISTHRADADVEALCSIYRILLAAIDAMPHSLVRKIASLAEEGEWPAIKVFKHFAANALAATEAPATASPATEAPANAPATTATTSEEFSLRNLRHHRIRELSLEAKPDADAIAANPQKELVFPDAEELAAAFGSQGMVGGLYQDYECREEQVAMAEKVRQAFATSTNLAIEAGTGVGKSMAYLFPAALIAQKNNIAIGVATKTNTLLDQLIYKELPLIATALGTSSTSPSASSPTATATSPSTATQPLSFASLKGFTHYPCLRKIDRLAQGELKSRLVAGKMLSQAPSLAALLSFIEQSEYDDIDVLKIDYRALPRYVITTKSTDCLRRKCPFYGTLCFVHGARRRAEAADIIVTNHSLLFCDIAADGGLLPPVRYWVIDEAHGAEAEARKAFSLEVSGEEVLRLSKRLSSEDAFQNPFVRAERRASDAVENSTLLFSQLTKARKAAKDFDEAAVEFVHHIKDLSFFSPSKRNKGYEIVELWINDEIRASETFATLASFGRVFCDRIEKLISTGQEVVGILEGADRVAEIQREIATIVMGLKEMLQATETILFSGSAQYAYAATLSTKQDKVAERLQALLVNVGERLGETLFANTHAVVFTSATLTVADSFTSFENALGLNSTEFSQANTCQLASSYDFDKQMTVYVPDDIPEPNDPAYLQAVQQLLIQAHLAQQGSLLTLFTNRREMEKCFEAVQPLLKAE
ncbi:MAG: hypothetical protein LBB35_00745, partial [Coriobacteriaceae bacterium]|nr:hypothetical protein [Coriobacteriaceae bacterium]